MLDLTGILISSIMMLIVILRAAQWDSRKPWFEGPPDADKNRGRLQKLRENAARSIPAWRRAKR